MREKTHCRGCCTFVYDLVLEGESKMADGESDQEFLMIDGSLPLSSNGSWQIKKAAAQPKGGGRLTLNRGAQGR